MPAVDTIMTTVANPGASYTATVPATGDSLVVRSFTAPATATLDQVIRGGATKGAARVRSPRLHDNVTGLNFATSENPSLYLFPRAAEQQLYSSDSLIAEVTGGGAETDAIALGIYYSSVSGANARLANWGDISGLIKNYKPFQISVTNSATIGAWTDTVITTTENQFHADADYAVLGYLTDTAFTVIGVKGQETGNLRICGPGAINSLDTAQLFVDLAQANGVPYIPVFNANNRASYYVSSANVAASTAGVVTLILAELSSPAPV